MSAEQQVPVKKEKAPPEVSSGIQGMVLWSDGGARPNPGNSGWGLHGYLYLADKPKKGAGNADFLLSDRGYVSKITAGITTVPHKEITPVHYVDGYGSFGYPATNNVAELAGALAGLEYAAQYSISSLTIYTDSTYVCQGLEKWVKGWERNGWIKYGGGEIPNVDLWKRLVSAKDALVAKGVRVKIEWVRSHNGDPGNEAADRLATVSVMAASRLGGRTEITSAPAEGYWKYEAKRHPFIANRRMYFNTKTEHNTPGVYYLGEHGKDDEMLGKRTSDGAYSLVTLGEPDPVLELVRNFQIQVAGETDSLVMLRVDHLFRPATHREITTHGTLAINQPSHWQLGLACMDEEPLTKELKPPRLAMRAVEAIQEMAVKLEEYQAGAAHIVVTDLTPILYETTITVNKKGESKTTMQLKPEYNVGFAALGVEANYLVGEAVSSAFVTLTLGIDLLDRNALKRLEDELPKVSLISWNESPSVFRYATVIEAGNNKGIWCGVYSNLRVIPQDEPVATPEAI